MLIKKYESFETWLRVFAIIVILPSSVINTLSQDEGMIPGTTASEIFDDNNTFYPTHFHKRGFQWNIYSVKSPMSWEITTGVETVALGVYDIWKVNTTNPDMVDNFQVTQNIGDGNRTTFPLGGDHGLTVISVSSADDGRGPVIGSAPNASSYRIGSDYFSYDLDQTVNNEVKTIDVINESLGTVFPYPFNYSNYNSRKSSFQSPLEAGIVLVFPVGNAMLTKWGVQTDPIEKKIYPGV